MKFFRDTSISNKILIPPAITMVALGTVLLLAIHGFNKQGSVLTQVHDIALERITLVNEFISLSESVQSDLFRITVLRFMNIPEPEIQSIHEHLGQGLSDMGVIYGQILSKWPLDHEEKKILEQMKVPMDAFSQEARQATEAVSQDPSFGIFLVRSAAAPFADFQRLLSQFLNFQKSKIARAGIGSRETVEKVETTIIVIALFMALIAIFISVWIGTRLISRPVRSITAAMGQLAAGNLSAGVGDLNRKDEIGAMGKAVEVFRENAMEKLGAEEALRESERKYRLLTENTRDVIFRTRISDATYEYVSPSAFEAFGYNPDDFYCNPELLLKMLPQGWDAYFRDKWDEVYGGKLPQTYEFPIIHKITGETRWMHQGNVWIRDKNDELIALQGSVSDITERKVAEEKLEASLREKEVLLREIHHRVKNNMQVITSLLRLQSDKIKDQQYADMFQESQERIRSMALIHEKLYQSKDLSRVDFNEYIKSLINSLFRSYGIDTGRIVTKLNVEDVSIRLDHAIPCGLIINELVSNSLKYAFPEDRKGEISVTLRSITKDEIELRVSDDGIGIPEDLNIRNTDSLGLELVIILAEDQLEGKIELDRTGGTTFRILFKGKNKEKGLKPWEKHKFW